MASFIHLFTFHSPQDTKDFVIPDFAKSTFSKVHLNQSPAHKAKVDNSEECRKIEIGFTHAAAEAFAKSIVPKPKVQSRSSRFVCFSEKFAGRDIGKKMWILKDARSSKIKYLQ